MNVAEHLKRRADSYSRDAFVLRDDGDRPMAVAYQTIADELRKCADEIDE